MPTNDKSLKDKWDKAGVILEPVGGFLTALSVAILGIIGSNYLSKKQKVEAQTRLFSELATRREEAESNLRLDMFKSIIGNFLEPDSSFVKKRNIEGQLLNLELLTYNFHESIDIGPLFKHIYNQIVSSTLEEKDGYLKRLEKIAKDVCQKQTNVLDQYGEGIEADIVFSDSNIYAVPIIDTFLSLKSKHEKNERIFTLYIEDYDSLSNEIKLSLHVQRKFEKKDSPVDFSGNFWVNYFDLPMIDNIRLSGGFRCAIVLNEFENNESAKITLYYFPGDYASLKEKPYYNEIIQKLLEANE